jgi:OFA family oxalate/formate antiporter-like MFS transporter
MFWAFSFEGVGILLLSDYGQNPTAFVLLTGLVFFAWGEIYSLFPATCADAYGRRYAASNYGLLYTAKGTAALLVPFTSYVAAVTGGWRTVFIAAAVMNLLAAIMALAVLKPLRSRMASLDTVASLKLHGTPKPAGEPA